MQLETDASELTERPCAVTRCHVAVGLRGLSAACAAVAFRVYSVGSFNSMALMAGTY
jgi:hypothetical protein